MKWSMILVTGLGFSSIGQAGTRIDNVNKATTYFTDEEAKQFVNAFVAPANENQEHSFNVRDRDFGFWLSAESERFGEQLAYSGHIEISRLHYNVVESATSLKFSLKPQESESIYKMMRGADVQSRLIDNSTFRSLKTAAFAIQCSENPTGFIPYDCSIEIFKAIAAEALQSVPYHAACSAYIDDELSIFVKFTEVPQNPQTWKILHREFDPETSENYVFIETSAQVVETSDAEKLRLTYDEYDLEMVSSDLRNDKCFKASLVIDGDTSVQLTCSPYGIRIRCE